MNIIKLTLIIAAILGAFALAAAPAIADTTFTGPGTDWHDGDNWDLGVPDANDKATIPNGTNGFDVVISSQDAECKELHISYKSSLKIQGRNFALGSSTADTISTLEGTTGGEAAIIYFEEAGGRIALMRVLSTVQIAWATFPGGLLDGSKDNGANFGGVIGNPLGTLELFKMEARGSLKFVCDALVVGENATVYVDHDDDVMWFSEAVVDPEPLDISGEGKIEAREGKMEFYTAAFAATSPNWLIEKGAEIQVSSDATNIYWVDLPFDIKMTGGTLDLDHDFDHEGKLTVSGNTPTTKIKVDGSAVATFDNK